MHQPTLLVLQRSCLARWGFVHLFFVILVCFAVASFWEDQDWSAFGQDISKTKFYSIPTFPPFQFSNSTLPLCFSSAHIAFALCPSLTFLKSFLCQGRHFPKSHLGNIFFQNHWFCSISFPQHVSWTVSSRFFGSNFQMSSIHWSRFTTFPRGWRRQWKHRFLACSFTWTTCERALSDRWTTLIEFDGFCSHGLLDLWKS